MVLLSEAQGPTPPPPPPPPPEKTTKNRGLDLAFYNTSTDKTLVGALSPVNHIGLYLG